MLIGLSCKYVGLCNRECWKSFEHKAYSLVSQNLLHCSGTEHDSNFMLEVSTVACGVHVGC